MTRSGEKTPSSPVSAGAGRSQKPGRAAVDTEAFGRFVSTLARLEGGAGRGPAGQRQAGQRQARNGKEGGR